MGDRAGGPSSTIPATHPAVRRGKLFTQDYLDEGITETGAWRDLDAEDIAALEARLRALFGAFPTTATPNEAVTEHDLIWPVLEVLGWAGFLAQQTTSGHGRLDVPDLLLFADEDAKRAAQAESREQDLACRSSSTGGPRSRRSSGRSATSRCST